MEKWLRVSLMLCTFGFLRELRPSEPYVTEYLTSGGLNVTSEQVNREVYPLGTYSVLAQLVLIFLVTDILRYKPIIVLSALAGIALLSLLLWSRTVFELQIGQLFYGTFMASEVAYYTYIYTKVPKSHYQIVTGHSRSAILAGKFVAAVLAQILISTKATDYRGLHFISFATQISTLPIALLLPSVSKSVYFYKAESTTDGVLDAQPQLSLSHAGRLLWTHTASAFRKPIVLQWSAWWAFANCGQLLVVGYIQLLWKDIAPEHRSDYNGGVEAIATLLGAGSAMAAGLTSSNILRQANNILVSCSTAAVGILLWISATTDNIWISYASYILFDTIFFYVITIAAANIAENLTDDSFGLVFGINTLASLLLQTGITIVAVTDVGLGLSSRWQYKIFGSYFLLIALVYSLVTGLCRILKCI